MTVFVVLLLGTLSAGTWLCVVCKCTTSTGNSNGSRTQTFSVLTTISSVLTTWGDWTPGWSGPNASSIDCLTLAFTHVHLFILLVSMLGKLLVVVGGGRGTGEVDQRCTHMLVVG